ncbi:F-box/FBD/LRR-repeat-like protein isoform X1 [Cinnamomum micranthum f. kanehirae]|uniref:F-box/FBD/LRR-repeat-like protein isoform X1 n=1 Tax=Cinnamomum micranthum f. kanehirae TaxID=337451 RepID=A0A443NQJ2_9MAGN|nr:F-box/FBD/LRR-repeat-like protein isoform X1 [Cinnamomum micranthum f. kanehirae]
MVVFYSHVAIAREIAEIINQSKFPEKPKQARQSSQGSVVSISDLPEDVKNLILSHLPIRDAVRTSILSKKWMHNWVSIPDIVFDKDCFIKGALKTEHANVVDQVLLGHVGPIRTFSCTPYVPRSSDIYRWIPFLSRNGIKNLILAGNVVADRYDVPSSIFYCQELCHLELSDCMLKVPPTSKGFQNLSVLNLFYVSISVDDIALLISKCPLLETLKLRSGLFDAFHFHIHAPNLVNLEVVGTFREFSLGNSSLLTNVSVSFNFPSFNFPTLERLNLAHANACSLTKFIGCSYGIERLTLDCCVIQFFCLAGVPEKLSVTLEHLKYLEVEIEWNSEEILAILCILRSSPNLKELKIRYDNLHQ